MDTAAADLPQARKTKKKSRRSSKPQKTLEILKDNSGRINQLTSAFCGNEAYSLGRYGLKISPSIFDGTPDYRFPRITGLQAGESYPHWGHRTDLAPKVAAEGRQ